MIRKRKIAIVVAGVLLLAGLAFGVSTTNRDTLKSDIFGAGKGQNSDVYAWYSDEKWTCNGDILSRQVQCVSINTGKLVGNKKCTDTKPLVSYNPIENDDSLNPPTCEQILSSLHSQRPYQDFKENMCASYPDVCRSFEKGNKKQPLYFSNARKTSDVGVVTTKKGWHVFEYGGSILGTQKPGMIINSLSYEISNYNPDTLKIGNIKLYDGITNVDSLNQFYCTQEYKKNTKKLLITCSLIQPKKTVFTVKESQGVVPVYLLFDVLKSKTSSQIMQLKFTGGVYNGKQTNWHDQTYSIRFKTLSEVDYCAQYSDRCEVGELKYNWNVSDWSKCTQGTQKITIYCTNQEGYTVKDSYCPSSSKPVIAEMTKTCETSGNKYFWRTSEWQACSNNVQTRYVACSDGTGTTVNEFPDSYCSDIKKPVASQTCTGSLKYNWNVSDWSQCKNGIQTITTYCTNQEGYTVQDSYCSGMTKPSIAGETTKSC